MDKDDSNSSEKNNIEPVNNSDKSGTLSSVTPSHSISSLNNVSITPGNLLSNISPPTSLPDFTLWSSSATTKPLENKPTPIVNTISSNLSSNTNITTVVTEAPTTNQFPSLQFSAAIPPSKGIPQKAPRNEFSQLPEAEAATSNSFFGYVKDALSSQVVTKMVEKAKNSVDSIITTLDPQMSEYIYSSGDLEITVTSDDEDIVSGIREAAHSVFGKAWVNGIKLGTSIQKTQAIGFENGIKNAEEKIACSLKLRHTPTIGIDNILLKQGKYWYDIYLLILKDLDNQIHVQTFSQATPIPAEKFLEKEVGDVDVENKLCEYLKAVPFWQEEVAGISRKDIIHLAAKVLLKLYKDRIAQKV